MKIKAIYDNNGDTLDRYTVVYDLIERDSPRLYAARGMSTHPMHPQGIGEFTTVMLGKHLGKRITFKLLPRDCQALVKADLTDEEAV